MAHLLVPVVVSMTMFSLGCFMIYMILKDRQKWDDFWEDQNRQRPLVPNSWPGSKGSKVFSYIFAIGMFTGGGIALLSSIGELLRAINILNH